jgi:hypothetical protein
MLDDAVQSRIARDAKVHPRSDPAAQDALRGILSFAHAVNYLIDVDHCRRRGDAGHSAGRGRDGYGLTWSVQAALDMMSIYQICDARRFDRIHDQ